MGVLEDYEKRAGLQPLTTEQIAEQIDAAENYLLHSAAENYMLHGEGGVSAERQRVMAWLSERVLAMSAALGDPTGTMACGWCWRAAGATQEIWRGLPKFTLADAQAHALVCDYNPLVLRIRELEAQLEEETRRVAMERDL